MFPFPVGVQLFNRPEYAKKMLNSIKEQTFQVSQENLFIYIDGFEGSIYDALGSENRTEEVETVAREIFPLSKIVRFKENRGIADVHNRLQNQVFTNSSDWGAFFEEDVVLQPRYLEEIASLIKIVGKNERVVKVACFQILPSLSHLPRGYEGFYPGRGTQAFAERRSFFFSRQKEMEMFIELSKNYETSPSQFRNPRASAVLAIHGYLLPYFQHDSFIENIILREGKLHVTTMPNLATDIGESGMHNYTTAPLDVRKEIQPHKDSLQQRTIAFENSLIDIHRETSEYALSMYSQIFEAVHTCRSRIRMLKKILKVK